MIQKDVYMIRLVCLETSKAKPKEVWAVIHLKVLVVRVSQDSNKTSEEQLGSKDLEIYSMSLRRCLEVAHRDRREVVQELSSKERDKIFN